MEPGVVCTCHELEFHGKNDQGKPISVVILETKDGMKSYYAPASLHWEFDKRKQTSYIKYGGFKSGRIEQMQY